MIINICGGGRWALEILQESLKIKKIKKINIITKNKILHNKYKNSKQIKFYKGVNKHLLKLKYKTIICNKLENHISSAKIFLQSGSEVLIEKPIFKYKEEFDEIKKYKHKIFFSKIFSFDSELAKFIKNIKKKRIKKIKILWSDKINEKRRGVKKKHNKKISFFFDTLHHIINLIELIFNSRSTLKIVDNFKFIKNDLNKTNFRFKINQILFECKLSRVSKYRKRILMMETDKKKYQLNFSKSNNKNINYSKIFNYQYIEKKNSLKKMINYFISSKFKRNKLSYIKSKNYIIIYKNLFQ